jgi:hypothetical protein
MSFTFAFLFLLGAVGLYAGNQHRERSLKLARVRVGPRGKP